MSPVSVLFGLVLVAILVRVVARAYTEVDDDFVEVWARAHALTLTDASRPLVRWYLHTARVLRTWGALGGYFLPPLIGAALGSDAVRDMLAPLVFVGYLAGALYAELALVRPAGGSRRVATLVPRDLDAYLPRRLRLAQRALGVVAIAAAVTVFAVEFGERSVRGGSSSRVLAVVMASVAVVLSLGLERVERWLVQRPQPFTAPDLVAADDAIRSQAVHSVAGSGLAVQLVCLGGVMTVLASSDAQLLRWTMWIPGLGAMVAAIWVCLYYGHRAWRVRRPIPHAATA